MILDGLHRFARHRLALVALGVAAAACSGAGGADAALDGSPPGDSVVNDAADAPSMDTPAPTDTPIAADTPTATDTPAPTDTGTSAMCTIAPITSRCGVAGAIRVTARLGAGMTETTGTLIVNLTHYRLGGGATGGVAHTSATRAGATVSPTRAAELSFDLCAGGEMWSEDNCEYNLWGFIDANGNRALDAGEPAGRATVNVSCHATASPCFELVLGCTTGMTCASFTDPGACRCGTPACTGAMRIVTCR